MKILHDRRTIHTVSYARHFKWRHDPGAGFAFDCEKDGNCIGRSSWQPAAHENLQRCLDGTFDVIDEGVKEFASSYTEPALGLCDCGAEVELPDPLDNVCPGCGACYNSGGQSVVPSWDCDPQGNPYDGDY